jgi:hypothetical protein
VDSAAGAAAWVVVALAMPAARAEVIGTDDFSYGGGIVVGQSGGSGWDWRNVAPTTHTGTASDWDATAGAPGIVSGKLWTTNAGVKREYNGPGEGGPPSDEANGAVNEGNVQKAVYYFVTVKAGTGAAGWGLSSYDFGAERVFFGVPDGQSNFGLNVLGGTLTLSGVRALPERTYQLVTRLDFAADRISLYVNPDLSMPESGNSPAATATYTGTNWSTAVRLASGGTGTVMWDNLKVVTTWADLAPAADAAVAYTFDSTTKKVTNWSGSVLTQVEGVNVGQIIDEAPVF